MTSATFHGALDVLARPLEPTAVPASGRQATAAATAAVTTRVLRIAMPLFLDFEWVSNVGLGAEVVLPSFGAAHEPVIGGSLRSGQGFPASISPSVAAMIGPS